MNQRYPLRNMPVRDERRAKEAQSSKPVASTPRTSTRDLNPRNIDNTYVWEEEGDTLGVNNTAMPSSVESSPKTIIVLSPESYQQVREGNLTLTEAALSILDQDIEEEVKTPPLRSMGRGRGSARSLNLGNPRRPGPDNASSEQVNPTRKTLKPATHTYAHMTNPRDISNNGQVLDISNSWGTRAKQMILRFLMKIILGCICFTIAAGPTAWIYIYEYRWIAGWILYLTSTALIGWFLWHSALWLQKHLLDALPKTSSPPGLCFEEAIAKLPSTKPSLSNSTRQGKYEPTCSHDQPHDERPALRTARQVNYEPTCSYGQPHDERPALHTEASGGWNGDGYTDPTPATNPLSSGYKPNNASASRNFKSSAAYANMSSAAHELSVHDQEVIHDISASQMTFSHTPHMPEFDGNPVKYAVFRRDFLSILPTIPCRFRLTALRNALVCLDAKKVIEDYEETDVDTFCEALKALDQEFNDATENVQHLLEEIRKLTQMNYKTDEDFVAKFSDLTSLLKRLVKIQPESKLYLEPLTRPWLDFVPEAIFRKAQNHMGRNKSWLNFDNLYEVAEAFAKSVKNTKSISASRNKAQRVRNVHQATVNEETESPQTSEEEALAAYYARMRPKPSCCFCNDETHHATACPKDMQKDYKKEIIYQQRRCILCLETGHISTDCPLLKMDLTLAFKCDCPSRTPHARIACQLGNPNNNK